ncbi:hypothetical protein CI102_13740 [Trichoderma harzianum]|uniref:Uncharacterized protein n=1 Tax=Trichoderma harzianum CBS 226.95 TaxID=983964 RepID=A0A2T4A7Y2_TRIHA|nr:hypothetical protein M431DRAFT_458573 [Trichoderma harzianum CBS 226.95]PKK41872.1 hypothetical protein CI102_13740 [Trichoderma harzianum]PTB53162.1 hypothetical protein M431DRAFT_458573 [Trichoderma harzianum CBS 226.95]
MVWKCTGLAGYCRASALACCLSTGSGSRSGTVLVPAGLRLAQILHRSTTLNRPTSTASPRVRERRERKKKGALSVLSVHAPLLCFGRLSPSSTRRSFISSHQPHHHLSPQIALGGSSLSPATSTLQYTTVPLLLLSTHLIFTSHQISSLPFRICQAESGLPLNPDRPN